jgi:hypothetical protein
MKVHMTEKVQRDNHFKRYNTLFNAKMVCEHRITISVMVVYKCRRWGAITNDKFFFVEVTFQGKT